MIKIIPSRNFKYGTVDAIEAQSIPRGAVSRSLNWLTMGDHMELRRGSAYIGTFNDGNGKVSGLKKTVLNDGSEQLFCTFAKKLKYLDHATADWLETGVDVLGAGVVDDNGIATESISLEAYSGTAGNQLWANSPNIADILKLLIANPSSYAGQYDSAKGFKGNIKIDANRMLLWARPKDQTGLYGSYIDIQAYTAVAGEAIVGPAGTLAFKAAGSKRTCFGVVIVIGAITYTDDFDGNLVPSDGSANGTINYVTGAFAGIAAGAGTASYQWEDSTNNGLADFTKSSPRTAGQGFIFPQADGAGALRAVGQFDQIYYCFHVKKTYVLNIGSADDTATNLPYRQNVGVQSLRGVLETGDGIYYGDDTTESNKRVRLLTYQIAGSTKIIPVSRSSNINLDDYNFDVMATYEYGDFALFSCATPDSLAEIDGENVPANNRTLVYNKIWKSWDVLDYGMDVFDTYGGALIGGSSVSNNILELFSGVIDTDDTQIDNFVEFGSDDLGHDGLDKVKYIHAQGAIGPDQAIKVSVATDDGDFVEVGGQDLTDPNSGLMVHTYAIEGSGSYVDKTNRVTIGPNVLGKHELGGGGDGIEAYNYDRLIPLRLDKGAHFKLRIEAVKVGFASWSRGDWYDVRDKGTRLPRKYRTNAQ